MARVESLEYLQEQNKEFFKEVGIHSLIMPEMIAAEEIVNNVQRSWIRQIWEVENSTLLMMGIKVRENCQILNVPLNDLLAS